MPGCVYLGPQFGLYIPASNNAMKILKCHADKFEQGIIDEAYLHLSSRVRNFDEAKDLVLGIMNEVLSKENLICSIGIGPNKIVAKIASDFKNLLGLLQSKRTM
jgi:DNA polymerase IV (DinB-like DNA polymerase)